MNVKTPLILYSGDEWRQTNLLFGGFCNGKVARVRLPVGAKKRFFHALALTKAGERVLIFKAPLIMQLSGGRISWRERCKPGPRYHSYHVVIFIYD